MKLEKITYQRKDGKQAVEYRVKKLNETGYGLAVNDKLRLELSFKPKIKLVTFNNNGTEKSFKSVRLLAKPLTEVENMELDSQYGNANFQLAEKLADKVENLDKGDVIDVYLKPGEINTPAGKKKITFWCCDVNNNTTLQHVETPRQESEINSEISKIESFMKQNPEALEYLNELHTFSEFMRKNASAGHVTAMTQSQIDNLYHVLRNKLLINNEEVI